MSRAEGNKHAAVLVTGARGLIGRHMLPLLAEHFQEVHAVSRGGEPAPEIGGGSAGVCWHRADLLDPAHVESLVTAVQPTHLVHLAWVTEHGSYWKSAENLQWVAASLELVRQFQRQGGRRLVLAGSCAEYEWSAGRCHERSTRLAPATLYGLAKHTLRELVEAFAVDRGLSVASSRIFHLYGPHENRSRLAPSVILSLLADRPARCSHGRQLRDFSYSKDVAAAHVRLLLSEACGAVNVASGRPVTVRQVVTAIAAELGKEDLVLWGAVPPHADDPAMLIADTSRLNSELGWQPRYSLQDGIRETIAWWKDVQAAERQAIGPDSQVENRPAPLRAAG